MKSRTSNYQNIEQRSNLNTTMSHPASMKRRPLHLNAGGEQNSQQSGPWRGKKIKYRLDSSESPPPPPPPPRLQNNAPVGRQTAYSQSPPPPPPPEPKAKPQRNFVFVEPIIGTYNTSLPYRNSCNTTEQDDEHTQKTVKSVSDLVNQFESKMMQATQKKHYHHHPITNISRSPTRYEGNSESSETSGTFDNDDDVTSLTVSEKTKVFEQIACQKKVTNSSNTTLVPQFQSKFVHAALRSQLASSQRVLGVIPPLQQHILSMQVLNKPSFPVEAASANNPKMRRDYNHNYFLSSSPPLTSTQQPSAQPPSTTAVVVDIKSLLKHQLQKNHYDRLLKRSKRLLTKNVDDDISSLTVPTMQEEGKTSAWQPKMVINNSTMNPNQGKQQQRYLNNFPIEPRSKPRNPNVGSPTFENTRGSPYDSYAPLREIQQQRDNRKGGTASKSELQLQQETKQEQKSTATLSQPDEIHSSAPVMPHPRKNVNRQLEITSKIKQELRQGEKQEKNSTATLAQPVAASRGRSPTRQVSSTTCSSVFTRSQCEIIPISAKLSSTPIKALRKTLFIVSNSDTTRKDDERQCPESPAPSDEVAADYSIFGDAPSDEKIMGHRATMQQVETTTNFDDVNKDIAPRPRNIDQCVAAGRQKRISLQEHNKSVGKIDLTTTTKEEARTSSISALHMKRQLRSTPAVLVESSIRSRVQTFEEKRRSVSRKHTTGLPPLKPRLGRFDDLFAHSAADSSLVPLGSDKPKGRDAVEATALQMEEMLKASQEARQSPPFGLSRSAGEITDRPFPAERNDDGLTIQKVSQKEMLQLFGTEPCFILPSESSKPSNQNSLQSNLVGANEAMDSANVSGVKHWLSESQAEVSISRVSKPSKEEKREKSDARVPESSETERYFDDEDDEICSITMRITRDSKVGPQVGVSISEYGKGSVEVSRLDTPTCQKVANLVLHNGSEKIASEAKAIDDDDVSTQYISPENNVQACTNTTASLQTEESIHCKDRALNRDHKKREESKSKSYPWRKPGDIPQKYLGGISAVCVASITPLKEQSSNLSKPNGLQYSASGYKHPIISSELSFDVLNEDHLKTTAFQETTEICFDDFIVSRSPLQVRDKWSAQTSPKSLQSKDPSGYDAGAWTSFSSNAFTLSLVTSSPSMPPPPPNVPHPSQIATGTAVDFKLPRLLPDIMSSTRSVSRSPQLSTPSSTTTDTFAHRHMRPVSQSPNNSRQRSVSRSPQPSSSSTSSSRLHPVRAFSISPLQLSSNDRSRILRSVSRSPQPIPSSDAASHSFTTRHTWSSVSRSPQPSQSSTISSDVFSLRHMVSCSPEPSQSSTDTTDPFFLRRMRPASQSPPHIPRLDLSHEKSTEISKILTQSKSSNRHLRVSLSPEKTIASPSRMSINSFASSQSSVPSPPRLSPTIVAAFEDVKLDLKREVRQENVRRVTFDTKVKVRPFSNNDIGLTGSLWHSKRDEGALKKLSKLAKLKCTVSMCFWPRATKKG